MQMLDRANKSYGENGSYSNGNANGNGNGHANGETVRQFTPRGEGSEEELEDEIPF